MPNEENLIKNEDLTPTERRERASKAGKASGAARRRRKKMKTALNDLLTLPPESKEAKKALEGMGVPMEEADNQTAVLAGLVKASMKGNPKAIKELRSILGEMEKAPEPKERKAPNDGFLKALSGKAAEDWQD